MGVNIYTGLMRTFEISLKYLTVDWFTDITITEAIPVISDKNK